MTEAKTEASELIANFAPHTDCGGDGATVREAKEIQHKHAKRCAIICVKEKVKGINKFAEGLREDTEFITMYYETVITEINNL